MNGNTLSISDDAFLREIAKSVQHADAWEVLASQLPVLVIAFLVTLVVTPIFRHIAIKADVVDHPTEARKIHIRSTPYLGGLSAERE